MIFEKMDVNGDKELTLKEFVDGCLQDAELFKVRSCILCRDNKLNARPNIADSHQRGQEMRRRERGVRNARRRRCFAPFSSFPFCSFLNQFVCLFVLESRYARSGSVRTLATRLNAHIQ